MQKWYRIVLFTIIVMMGTGVLSAAGMSPDELGSAAARFILSRPAASVARIVGIDRSLQPSVRELTDPETGMAAAYVVDLAPEGFVVLGPDRTVRPVIMWSADGQFPDGEIGVDPYITFVVRDIGARRDAYGNLPVDVQESIATAWDRFLDGGSAKVAAVEQQWPAPGTTSTGGWVETTWGQLAPYNKFCPLDAGMDNTERSATGCVPTTLSQVINFHKYIGGMQLDAGDSYFSPCGPETLEGVNIDSDSGFGDFLSFEELNGYLADIDSKYTAGEDLNEDEIAALNFAIGILAEAQYSFLHGTGASDDWFFENFIDKHGIGYTYEIKNPHNDDFYAVLKSNIMEGLPVTLMINKTYVCAVNHEVIVDGYSTSGFYHLNFGWSDSTPDGIESAWYLLPEGMGAGYDLVQAATMNIRPMNNAPGDLAADPMAINLGYAPAGETTSTGSTIITNTGDVEVRITGISAISPQFGISLDNVSFAQAIDTLLVPVGGSVTLFARCTPDSVGIFTGEALVFSSDGHCLPIEMTALGLPLNGTVVPSGQVSGTWNADGSPYLITDDIEVWSNEPLFIKPGVEVVFLDRFELTLQPGSSFQAIGTDTDSIYFRPYNPNRGWQGITIVGVDDEPENERNQIFDHCVITGGASIEAWPQNIGGAFRIVNATPLISHCSILGNVAAGSGTAMSIEAMYGHTTSRAPHVTNTVIAGNYGNGAMGTVKVSGVTGVRFDNVTITSNVCKYGGALALHEGASVYLTNCILWNNRVIEGGKGGVFNLGSDVHYNAVADTVVISYSMVDTTATNWLYDETVPGVVTWGEGCIVEDPSFTGESLADYTLAAGSPCIDSGSPLERYRDRSSAENPEAPVAPSRGTILCDMGAFGGGGYSVPPSIVRVAVDSDGINATRVIRWDPPSADTVTGYKIYRSLAATITTVDEWPGFDDINTQIEAEWFHTYLLGTVPADTFEFVDPYDGPAYMTYHYWVSAVTGDMESEKILAGEPLAIGEETAAAFRLDPAFPNPFNPVTSIRFELPFDCRARLTVYDVLGRTVRVLEDDMLSSGVHTARWNGVDENGVQVSSGVYLYRLTTPGFTAGGKLLLMR